MFDEQFKRANTCSLFCSRKTTSTLDFSAVKPDLKPPKLAPTSFGAYNHAVGLPNFQLDRDEKTSRACDLLRHFDVNLKRSA